VTDAPNKLWGTDFTCVLTRVEFADVSFVIDLFSRRILSCASSSTYDTEFVEQAVQMASWQRRTKEKFHMRPVLGIIHRSNPGTAYSSQKYTQKLADEGLVPSIGTIGDAYDIASAETVKGLFKNEVIAKDSPFRTGPLVTESDVSEVAADWVHWYNNERFHSTLRHRTPAEFEEHYYDEMSG